MAPHNLLLFILMSAVLPSTVPFMFDDVRECLKVSRNPPEDLFIDAEQIIRKNNYPLEIHSVISEDGYILTIYRIPGSPSSPQPKSSKNKPVLLNHGIAGTGERWLHQEPSKSLPLLLANAGFDVFILNGRGSKHSQLHVNLSTAEDKYWDFSFHEQGMYDLPAVIQKILTLTGRTQLYYVGYSSGTTQYFIGMSERPEMNSKIATAFLISPVAFLSHSTSNLRHLVPFVTSYSSLLTRLLGTKLTARSDAAGFFNIKPESLCSFSFFSCLTCMQVLYTLFGHSHPSQENYASRHRFLTSYPEAVSTKTVLHFSQLLHSGKFQQFDYGESALNMLRYGLTEPPVYNLSVISAPTVFVVSAGDDLAVPQDVRITASQMSPLAFRGMYSVPLASFTHLDMILGSDADVFVYSFIVNAIHNESFLRQSSQLS